jgi:hypothetical protein
MQRPTPVEPNQPGLPEPGKPPRNAPTIPEPDPRPNLPTAPDVERGSDGQPRETGTPSRM